MLTFVYYIKCFFYIALNWNIRLALFSIYHEVKGERKYNINTSRLDDLKHLSVKGYNRNEAEIYQGANYYLLENIFTQLRKLNTPVDITDIGSGKGRVMVVAAHYGFSKITGVDFARALCQEAENNCRIITKRFPLAEWKVLHADAVDFRFKKDDHVFFFFNPFKETIMKQVIKNILQSVKEYPRKIFVVYMNPQHKNSFITAGFKEVCYIKRMQFVDAVIFEKSF